MNKATEVMMQYVENLKRTYEKDHAELMEFKKLANQNSIRCYGGSIDTGGEAPSKKQNFRPQVLLNLFCPQPEIPQKMHLQSFYVILELERLRSGIDT